MRFSGELKGLPMFLHKRGSKFVVYNWCVDVFFRNGLTQPYFKTLIVT